MKEIIENQPFYFLCSSQFLNQFFFGEDGLRASCAFMKQLLRSRQFISTLQSYNITCSSHTSDTLLQTFAKFNRVNEGLKIQNLRHSGKTNGENGSTGFSLLNAKDIEDISHYNIKYLHVCMK